MTIHSKVDAQGALPFLIVIVALLIMIRLTHIEAETVIAVAYLVSVLGWWHGQQARRRGEPLPLPS